MCVHRLACKREFTPLKMFTTIIIIIVFRHLAIDYYKSKSYYWFHTLPTDGIGHSWGWGGVLKGQNNFRNVLSLIRISRGVCGASLG